MIHLVCREILDYIFLQTVTKCQQWPASSVGVIAGRHGTLCRIPWRINLYAVTV